MTHESNDYQTPSIEQRLEQLTELCVELSSNHDTPLLTEHILRVAQRMSNADGGTLYRVSKDGKNLHFNISINDSLGMYQGGVRGQAIEMADLPLLDINGQANLNTVAAYAANMRCSVNIPDIYQADGFSFTGMLQFDQQQKYRTVSLLTVPMLDHENELIGVLQLINAINPQTKIISTFSDTDQRFIEALASQAAIALTNQLLISQLENLFESLIKLINIGIDEKSPHTGKHCMHVPELTMMLADAVHLTDSGPLADFKMSVRDRKELWMAGLLHDCGKITTPTHVVEKSTKLEMIYDRIHAIDCRFEVLKRDAEICILKQKLANADLTVQQQLDQALQQELIQLEQDRDFLRHANIGGERMSMEDQERVKQIANYQWCGADNVMGNFLDQEEVDNLTIRAGTLNPQERSIINNHIVLTIKMLEALPWPRHLQNVPEYAGGHHERMDGKGYPRGLRGEQMSVQARLMAIADIFEALTAKDRPYKTGKMLTESLDILGRFCLNGHIDPAIFDVFVRRKVYLDYAKRFMDPEQLDEVDENKIPGYMVL
ncbi:GAF and HD-GYP domain-containing protein [Solimicrobium silvestre]|nr:HD family phosphohydrolase [Solimicrobium silvestre]